MANKLSRTQINKMWEVYQEHENLDKVSKICDVSWATAERYCKIEGWADRLKEIKATATAKANEKSIDKRAKEIETLDSIAVDISEKIAGELSGLDAIAKSSDLLQVSASLEKITKLRELLQGEPTEITGKKEAAIADERRNQILNKLANIEDAKRKSKDSKPSK